MLNIRRYGIIVSVIIITSVFLSSCGIGVPFTIYTESGTISFYEEKKENEENNEIGISISTTAIQADLVQGPSLVLVYAISDKSDQIPETTIKNTYLSGINSLWRSKVSTIVDTDTSKQLFEYSNDSNILDFYLYRPLTETKITDFNYHCSLTNIYNSDHTINGKIKLEISDDDNLIKVGDNEFKVDSDLLSTEKRNCYVFAAITASNGSYIYTTNLFYLTNYEIKTSN